MDEETVGICKKCGLPITMCVCEDIGREQQSIIIGEEKRKYQKCVTTIKGINSIYINVRSLVKTLKTALACGGTFKNSIIELQGKHKDKVKQLLIDKGFSTDKIKFK